jgi:uncharacterized membrane protein YcaP (DUF421 family)
MDARVWTDILQMDVPILEKIIRPVLVYLFLIVGLRLAGKRELAQLNPFDLVVLLTLSNTVQNAIIGNDNSVVGGLIGATTLLVVNYAVVRFFYRHEHLDRLIEGDSDVLIDDGQLQEEHLKKELITRTELEAAARRQGFASLAEVERAVLEPGGTISFIGKRPTPESTRHAELLAKLNDVLGELAELKRQWATEQGRTGSPPQPDQAL